jgi:hypothetical protein
LKAGMGSHRVQIRVVLRPALVPKAVLQRLLQTIDRLVDQTLEGIHAGNIVEDAAILGINRQSAASPIQAASALAQLAEIGRTQVECTGIVWVQFQVLLCRPQRAPVGTSRLRDTPLGIKSQRQHAGRLVVFRLQLRSVLEQLSSSFKFSLLETGPRVKVKGLVKLGVELERDLEFSFGFLVTLAELNRQSAGDMSLRQIRVKQQSLLARIVGRLQVFLAGLPVHVEVGVAIGDSGEGARISRIEFNRP